MMNYSHAIDVVPSDSVNLTVPAWAFVTGSNGTVKVTTFWGDVVTLTCVAGFTYTLRVYRIWATGTTATNIVGMW
jgi:hypothetical protein